MNEPYKGLKKMAHRILDDAPPQNQKQVLDEMTRLVQQAVNEGVAKDMDFSNETLKTLREKFSQKRKQDKVQLRKKKFQKQSHVNAYVTTQLTSPLIGTCENLEKPYFRLTGQVNPEVVRPLHVLERSFEYVLKKYRKNDQYGYIQEQLQSIRQDLTVQHINNEFASKVYKTNVLIALKYDDLGEFNKCLARLRSMCFDYEFEALNLLYLTLTKNWSQLNQLKPQPSEFDLTPGKKYDDEITQIKNLTEKKRMYHRAVAITNNVLTRDILVLEKVSSVAYPLESKLINLILTRERFKALKSLLQAFGTTKVLTSLIPLNSDFLKSVFHEEEINCKDALQKVESEIRKCDIVDLKGQK